MRRRARGALLAAALVFAPACASIPAPDVLAQLDQVRGAPAAAQAKERAPTAYALAEKLRAEAHAAFEAGDTAGAQILGERALAAYQEAVALGRAAHAEQSRVSAAADADAAARRLAELDREHQKVATDIAALEKRLEALRAAEPPESSGPARPERERARVEAVRTLGLQARLLCASARLLAQSAGQKTAAELDAAEKGLAELDELVAGGKAAPIDHAMRARADCLRALTAVRRAQASAGRAGAGGDAVLAALSKTGVGSPRRDDRGVVVTLRDVFAGEKLSPSAEKSLDALAGVAKEHASIPLLVVLHQTREPDAAGARRWRDRGEKLVSALKSRLGRDVGGPEIAGAAAPLVERNGKHSARNERVEIVFVTSQPM